MDKLDSNNLGITWHDSHWIPMLNQNNVLDYFSERSNPFYDRTCNNEVIKMQHLSPDHLINMTGVEFTLLHAQEPILYIVRKQNRLSPTQVTPLANYYIIAGVVYQGPDLGSVINSRIVNTVTHLQSAFDEVEEEQKNEESKKKKEEPSSLFQRHRVDLLLGEIAKKFPPQFVPPPPPETKEPKMEPKGYKSEKADDKSSGDMKPPPEKKARLR